MQTNVFPYDELRYYGFGLLLGVTNILQNGFRLGAKKTLGKILQPINSYTRFPEYYFLGSEIENYLQRFTENRRPKILDIGSPKCFGLYLAFHFDVEIHLTDIDEATIEEAKILWKGIKDRSKGEAVFSVRDVRNVNLFQEFDVVYSMSVIEHVEGKAGDSESIREMIRALKPGGLLLVTVPVGQRYVEQDRIGFQGAARATGDQSRYFFQRIYTPTAAEERIIQPARNVVLRRVDTVWRKFGMISKIYQLSGTEFRGLFGCLNPLLSAALNESHEGFFPAPSQYGDLHSESDVYGDLVLVWQKDSITNCKLPLNSQPRS